MPGIARAVESAVGDARRGLRAPLEDIVVGALVALPFSGTLAILLAAAGLPGAVGVVVAGLAQGLGTFWIAGALRRGQDH
jgi:hypothetical protein